mgnify:CR=1 FL=1
MMPFLCSLKYANRVFVLYLCNGIYEDPSGNWHELDRAIILLIGVAAFELCTSLPIKPLILRYAA